MLVVVSVILVIAMESELPGRSVLRNRILQNVAISLAGKMKIGRHLLSIFVPKIQVSSLAKYVTRLALS